MTDQGPATASIPIYCINLASASDRRARMRSQFERFDLLGRVHFVPAIGQGSRKVDEHLARLGFASTDRETRAVAACWLSHVRALRTFLREQPRSVTSCIVFEDDVLLHREWTERLEEVLANLPEAAPVCALGYNDEDWMRPFESWEGFAWSGRQPRLKNLTAVLTRQWGAHAYWTSRRHARYVLHHANTGTALPSLIPAYVPQRRSIPVPEAIQKVPGAFSAFPSLAIQDGTSSAIRDDAEVRAHRRAHASWGVENYVAHDAAVLGKRSAGPSICLCATVCNEGERIDRLASELAGFIDAWVISDTGSTDGTPERVVRAFADVPGQLYRDQWHDDGSTRSVLIERARERADYLLLVEASHSLIVREQLGPLDADAYALPFVDPGAGWAPMLVRSELPWRAVGAINATLVCDQPYRVEELASVVVRLDQSETQRTEQLRHRLARAAAVTGASEDRHRPFELAELHRQLGQDDEALQLYRRRLELGGPQEQLWEAMYRHAEVVAKGDWEHAVALLLESWEFLPSRPEPLWTLAHGYRVRDQLAPAELLLSQARRLRRPELPASRFRHVYDWGLDYEWSLVSWRQDPATASTVCGDLLSVPTVPDELLGELKEHYWRCVVAAVNGAGAGRGRGAPTLSSLIPATATGPLVLDVDGQGDFSHPSVASDEGGFRGVLRLRDRENPWDTAFCEVRLAPDLSVVDARMIADERPPGSVPLGAFRRSLLVRCDADFMLVGSPDGLPSGSPAVVLPLVGGRFEGPELLVGSGMGTPVHWAPFSRDGALFFLTGFDPTRVLCVDAKTGVVTSTLVGTRPDELGEERAASPGVEVEGGTLFVTNRVLVDGSIEHRFVLLDEELEVAGASRGFCFFRPVGELCFGLARQDDDLVLSFGAQWGWDPFLARVPYRAVLNILAQ